MATLVDVSATAAGGRERAAEQPSELAAPGTPGAVQCKAPGCEHWFIRRSGRHAYCKAPDCTYRRSAPPGPEVEVPDGAAAELLRRLQDPEGGGEVGPELITGRLRAVGEAQRSGDAEAWYGALVDAGVVFVRTADRVRDGLLVPRQAGEPRPRVPTQRPVGLAAAALASHARTVTLAERRHEAVWEMLRARETLAAAERGVQQTAGTEQSVQAEAMAREARALFDRAERALQALEAAWAERKQSLAELEAAAVPMRSAGANGRAA